MLESAFIRVLNMSFTAGLVILLVLAARLLLKKAPKNFSYALWAVVLFRLVCPFSFESLFSLLPVNSQPIPQDIALMAAPIVNTGIPTLDQTIASSLPAATELASANPLQVLLFFAQILWLAGAAVLLLYSLILLFGLKKRLHTAVLWKDNIFISDEIDTAFVLGLFCPKIYLPAQLTENEREVIVLHEQFHIRRLDPAIKLLSFLALCVHWFNPLVWVAFFLSGKDREMRCDEAVISRLGSPAKKEYASSLLTLATGRRIVGGTPLAFGEGETKGRVKNVLRYKKPAVWVLVVLGVAVAALCVGLLANPRQSAVGTEVDAVIIGINTQDQTLIVRGTQENSVLGDQCIVNCAQAQLEKAENGRLVSLTWEELAEGDSVTLNISDVQETYPTQTTASRVQLQQMEIPAATVGVEFPAYDQRTEYNAEIFDIDPFTLYLQLPAGWSIRAKSETDTAYPLTGAWTPLGIYNEENLYVGAVGYNLYEEYEGAENDPKAIYSQIALGNDYSFDVRSENYSVITETDNGSTAMTRVYNSPQMSLQLGYGEKETWNKGILCLNRSLKVYVALELDDKKVSDEIWEAVAQSLQLAPTTAKTEDVSEKETSLTAAKDWQWPVPDYTLLAQGFDGQTHNGLDLAASYGAPIDAAQAGTVAKAEYDSTGDGNFIEITHADGLTTRYCHCADLLVTAGDTVYAGEQIATVGSTGNSTGNHCHFELLKDGSPVDPLGYLSQP